MTTTTRRDRHRFDETWPRWLRTFPRRGATEHVQPDLRLVCFPHAGGTAGAYRGWQRLLPTSVELLAVQYPGRGDRSDEPAADSLTGLAEGIATALAERPGTSLAYFGHSMGGTVAYEVARRLPPVHLFVSARRAPDETRPEQLDFPTEEALLGFVRGLGGSGARVAEYPVLREEMFPVLRGDLALLSGYRYRPAPPLDCPVTGLAGADDPMSPRSDLLRWAEHTTAGFDLRGFPGGHFFTEVEREAVVSLLLERLGWARGPAGGRRQHRVGGCRGGGDDV